MTLAMICSTIISQTSNSSNSSSSGSRWARNKTKTFLESNGQNLLRIVEKSQTIWSKQSSNKNKKMPYFDHFPHPGIWPIVISGLYTTLFQSPRSPEFLDLWTPKCLFLHRISGDNAHPPLLCLPGSSRRPAQWWGRCSKKEGGGKPVYDLFSQHALKFSWLLFWGTLYSFVRFMWHWNTKGEGESRDTREDVANVSEETTEEHRQETC